MDPTSHVLSEPKLHDLGDGFAVRRMLPSARQRTVGPFVFFDHIGPVDFAPGNAVDVRPHPHIGLSTMTYLFEGIFAMSGHPKMLSVKCPHHRIISCQSDRSIKVAPHFEVSTVQILTFCPPPQAPHSIQPSRMIRIRTKKIVQITRDRSTLAFAQQSDVVVEMILLNVAKQALVLPVVIRPY